MKINKDYPDYCQYNSLSLSMKVCTKCKKEKETTEFVKDKYTKDGLTYQCKECRNKFQRTSDNCKRLRRQYKIENKDAIHKQGKEYYLKNKKSIDLRTKLWYKNNKDKHRQLVKIWSDNNKDKIAQYTKIVGQK